MKQSGWPDAPPRKHGSAYREQARLRKRAKRRNFLVHLEDAHNIGCLERRRLVDGLARHRNMALVRMGGAGGAHCGGIAVRLATSPATSRLRAGGPPNAGSGRLHYFDALLVQGFEDRRVAEAEQVQRGLAAAIPTEYPA